MPHLWQVLICACKPGSDTASLQWSQLFHAYLHVLLKTTDMQPCFTRSPSLTSQYCVQSLQYWLGGSSDNLENLLLNTVRAYVPDLKGVDIEVAEPQLFLDTGIWHPCAPCKFSSPWLSTKQLLCGVHVQCLTARSSHSPSWTPASNTPAPLACPDTSPACCTGGCVQGLKLACALLHVWDPLEPSHSSRQQHLGCTGCCYPCHSP